MRPKRGKLKLEDYNEFVTNPYREEFNNSQLNQIIQMHGFIKLHRCRKKELLKVLSKMELQSPRRSTLKAEILPYVSRTTVDQVKHDLDALGWQESAVGSVDNLDPTVDGDFSGTGTDGCDFMGNFTVTPKKRRSKRVRRVDEGRLDVDGGDEGSGIIEFDVVDHDVDTLLDQLTSGPWA